MEASIRGVSPKELDRSTSVFLSLSKKSITFTDLSRMAMTSIGSPLESTAFGLTPAAMSAFTSEMSSNLAALVKLAICASLCP